jgi:hypothetical protein
MPSGSCSPNRSKKRPVLSLDTQILCNDHSYPKPKEKKANKEAWKQFFALCLGLLALPSLAFSAEQSHYLERPQTLQCL